MKVGDNPKVCCTAFVASSEMIRRMLSAASESPGRPHSASTLAT
ncbi:hypothetical protein STRTUCAR8_01164 [Streptomyces turgidiscabies Car8]|uniref:Uncharacterized protein n=1 Tax=Streptomyces turgidiscabies (strain Car8) TaxID=698760 RepID=L7F170_STRT8|nr:hypothetical protein STRTUCAR8_01164 [Streptomyces turgidiscabies Car8]